MKMILVFLCFINLAIADVKIKHIVSFNPTSTARGKLIFFINKIVDIEFDLEFDKAVYRHQEVFGDGSFRIYFEKNAVQILSLTVEKKDKLEILKSFEFELEDKQFIRVKLLGDSKCEVTSGQPLLIISSPEVIPCIYEILIPRGGMSGSN